MRRQSSVVGEAKEDRMRKSRFNEEKIIGVLKEVESGGKVEGLIAASPLHGKVGIGALDGVAQQDDDLRLRRHRDSNSPVMLAGTSNPPR